MRRSPTRISRVSLFLTVVGIYIPPLLSAQGPATSRYHSTRELVRQLDSLARRAPRVAQVTTIAQSPGGLPLPVLRLAAGADADERPALLVIANAAGPEIAGSEILLGVARVLGGGYGSDSAITRLLDRRTIYLVPRANPDAAEALFARPMLERTGNALAIDDDHDGATDEDGPDDLNGDGFITLMRVTDSTGDWMADSTDPFLLRKAERGKGQAGLYTVYQEGRDNDHDERWNEDPPGGVDVNRNLSYGYQFFREGSGDGPIATPESRALAQFFVDHPNVTAVYVLGPQDNLVKPWEFKKDGSSGDGAPKPLTSVLENDEPYFAEVARRYQRLTGRDKGPASADLQGDPLSFSYYHMGRFAFGTRAWWIPEPPADTSKSAPKVDPKDSLKTERNTLRWLRANRPDAILEWKEINHPDFPGRRVEVGGFRPFATLLPPDSLLDSLTAEQGRFIRSLAELLPTVEIRDLKVDPIGNGVFRITAKIVNSGYLPTVSELGARVRWPRRIRVELKGQGIQVEAGRRIQLLDAIPGSGGSRELTWLVTARAGLRATIEASSPVAGHATISVAGND